MKRHLKTVGFFLAALFVMVGALVFMPPQDSLRSLLSKIPLGLSAPVFVLLYVAANFVVVDIKDAFKLVGAIVFGAWMSAFLIYIAELLNAVIFFNLSRKLGQEFARKMLKNGAGFYDRLSQLPVYWVFLLRAVPVIPYRVLDIVFGMSAMRFNRYMLAAVLASFPRILFIQIPLAAVGSFSMEGFMDYWRNHPKILFAGFCYIVFTAVVVIAFHLRFKAVSRPVVK